MAYIGGNIKATIQTMTTTKNAIGEAVKTWTDAAVLSGWLGMQSGEKNRASFNAKVEQSSHVFVTEFDSSVYSLADCDTRMVCKGFVYDVTYIDNPDEMDKHLEIYLKRVGAWDGR